MPIAAQFYSHFTNTNCRGNEVFYLPNSAHVGGAMASWDGGGIAGTIVRTMTTRSWRNPDGSCNNGTPSGYTEQNFVMIYRASSLICADTSCEPVSHTNISHFTARNCVGTELFFTPNAPATGGYGSWDGGGMAGITRQTFTVYSYRRSDGVCVGNAYPSGSSDSRFVYIYRTPVAPAALSVYIDGPSSIYAYQQATWTATTSGGLSPVSVQWFVDGTLTATGSSLTTSFGPGTFHEIRVEASDGHQGFASSSMSVWTSQCALGSPGCNDY